MNLLDVGEKRVGLGGKVTNFSVGVKTEHLRNFSGEGLLNVFFITLPVKFLRDGRLETSSHGELHLLEDLGLNELQQVGTVATSIPVISDMTTVHDISEDISKISVWDFLVTSKVVMDNLTANGEITIIEVIVSRPALSSELLATKNKRVEHAESEQECLVFLLFVTLSLFEFFLLELGEGTT